jgi:hypothetical protein
MNPSLKTFLRIAFLLLHIHLTPKDYWGGIIVGLHASLVFYALIVMIHKGTKEVEYKDIAIYMAKNNKSSITFDEIDRLSKTL